MRHERVTITLNRIDLEPFGEEELRVYAGEWAHAIDVQVDELGITIDEGRKYTSFFPWTSVLRVDREPCRCSECEAS